MELPVTTNLKVCCDNTYAIAFDLLVCGSLTYLVANDTHTPAYTYQLTIIVYLEYASLPDMINVTSACFPRLFDNCLG